MKDVKVLSLRERDTQTKVELKPKVQNQKKTGAAPRARSVPRPYGAVAKMPSLESAGLESEPSSFVH